jgi:hypothetical protein
MVVELGTEPGGGGGRLLPYLGAGSAAALFGASRTVAAGLPSWPQERAGRRLARAWRRWRGNLWPALGAPEPPPSPPPSPPWGAGRW